jgi:uncharacterized protein YndB with AHSA1/START domain
VVRFSSTTMIARPARDVFEFVTDVRNDPKWHTDVLEANTAGAVGEGTVFNTTFKPFMGKSEGTMTVAEYAPPNRAVLKGRLGKMAPTITYTFEADGPGTKFTRTVDISPPGLMRLMAPLMKGMMQKQNAGFLANLKRALEAG